MVHHGSVVSPLLLTMVFEGLSEEFRTGCTFELLHTDNFVIIAESLEELSQKYAVWKFNLKNKHFEDKHEVDRSHVNCGE